MVGDKTEKRGFTLLELLVVIGIIGLLIALLLPAVRVSSGSSRRMSCGNNLKNLALACHNYHDVYKSFPAGWVSPGEGILNQNANVGMPHWGWGALILPFVEQQPLHTTIQVTRNNFGDAMAVIPGNVNLDGESGVMQIPISTYKCPSDVAPNTNSDRPVGGGSGPGNFVANSNYIGVNNSGPLYSGSELNDDFRQNGIFRQNYACKVRDVLDGTAFTMMIGERVWQYKARDGQRYNASAGIVFGLPNSLLDGTVPNMANNGFDPAHVVFGAQVGGGAGRINYDFDGLNSVAQVSFSSMHSGGSQFAMADGTVHFISETINFSVGTDQQNSTFNDARDSVYEQLLSRDDGESVEIP